MGSGASEEIDSENAEDAKSLANDPRCFEQSYRLSGDQLLSDAADIAEMTLGRAVVAPFLLDATSNGLFNPSGGSTLLLQNGRTTFAAPVHIDAPNRGASLKYQDRNVDRKMTHPRDMVPTTTSFAALVIMARGGIGTFSFPMTSQTATEAD